MSCREANQGAADDACCAEQEHERQLLMINALVKRLHRVNCSRGVDINDSDTVAKTAYSKNTSDIYCINVVMNIINNGRECSDFGVFFNIASG